MPEDTARLAARRLALPVQGVRAGQLADTISQARASGARRHDATDIPAPAGTPVLAVEDGRIAKLFFSQGGGGITVYQFGPGEEFADYCAHLQAYTPGLREGQMVRHSQVIGYVGASADARRTGTLPSPGWGRTRPGGAPLPGAARAVTRPARYRRRGACTAACPQRQPGPWRARVRRQRRPSAARWTPCGRGARGGTMTMRGQRRPPQPWRGARPTVPACAWPTPWAPVRAGTGACVNVSAGANVRRRPRARARAPHSLPY